MGRVGGRGGEEGVSKVRLKLPKKNPPYFTHHTNYGHRLYRFLNLILSI